jgi:hypothetical protein
VASRLPFKYVKELEIEEGARGEEGEMEKERKRNREKEEEEEGRINIIL